MGNHVRDGHDGHEPAPRLDVQQRLPGVIPSPLPRRDAHLVRPQPLDRNHLFPVPEVLGLHGRIRHEDQDDNRVGHREQAAEQKDDLVLEQDLGLDVAQAEGEQAADDGRDAVHGVPVAGPQRLLAATPPHLGDGDAAGRDHGLEGAEQEAQREQGRKVCARRHDCLRRPPQEDGARDQLARRQLDQQEGRQRLHHQLRQVEDRSEPRVLLVDQLGVLGEAENGDVAGGGR